MDNNIYQQPSAPTYVYAPPNLPYQQPCNYGTVPPPQNTQPDYNYYNMPQPHTHGYDNYRHEGQTNYIGEQPREAHGHLAPPYSYQAQPITTQDPICHEHLPPPCYNSGPYISTQDYCQQDYQIPAPIGCHTHTQTTYIDEHRNHCHRDGNQLGDTARCCGLGACLFCCCEDECCHFLTNLVLLPFTIISTVFCCNDDYC